MCIGICIDVKKDFQLQIHHLGTLSNSHSNTSVFSIIINPPNIYIDERNEIKQETTYLKNVKYNKKQERILIE